MSSAQGAVECNEARMMWTIDDSGQVLEIDTGMRMLVLTQAQAVAMLEMLNTAIPHMAVSRP